MTLQELQQDKLKRRREVLNAILSEFEEFGIDCGRTISKNEKGEYDYDTVNLRVLISPFFFDFRFDLDRDELVLNAYTNKQLTNNGGVARYPLTMANIDELLMAIKSYENVYVPKFE